MKGGGAMFRTDCVDDRKIKEGGCLPKASWDGRAREFTGLPWDLQEGFVSPTGERGDAMKYLVYVDGASSNNQVATDRTGAWGAIILRKGPDGKTGKKVLSGDDTECMDFVAFIKRVTRKSDLGGATNNQMELWAVIKALEAIETEGSVESIKIVSDSKYVTDAINLGWLERWVHNGFISSSKKPIENQDIWLRMFRIMARLAGVTVEFIHVKGHSGDRFNEEINKKVQLLALNSRKGGAA
jgi:ribonuclease HI